MPGCFEKFIFELEAFSYQNGIECGKAVDVTSKNVCVISKVHYFDFLVSCLYTFNPLSLSLKWVTVLVATISRNMESGQSCKTIYMMRVKVPSDSVKSFNKVLLSVLETSIVS